MPAYHLFCRYESSEEDVSNKSSLTDVTSLQSQVVMENNSTKYSAENYQENVLKDSEKVGSVFKSEGKVKFGGTCNVSFNDTKNISESGAGKGSDELSESMSHRSQSEVTNKRKSRLLRKKGLDETKSNQIRSVHKGQFEDIFSSGARDFLIDDHKDGKLSEVECQQTNSHKTFDENISLAGMEPDTNMKETDKTCAESTQSDKVSIVYHGKRSVKYPNK